jgi:transposase
MYYCGLDVSLRQTAICVVDGDGTIVSETKVASAPEAVTEFLVNAGVQFERIGLKAGSTAAWLQAGLRNKKRPQRCAGVGAHDAAQCLP